LVSPFFYASLLIGGALIVVGSYACVTWYIFWNREYTGQLLTDGPYSRVRHPFYSGFLALTAGLAIALPIMETVALALLSVAVIVFYIQKEEEFLIQRYGKAYREYMRRVPWKMIPRVY
jgi:protein-S-isoprenylcysteine O-methyltransferase Ste14